jgi:DNA-binding transcriptional MerR regulator
MPKELLPIFYPPDRSQDIRRFEIEGKKFIEFITQNRKRLNISEVSYRAINHWAKLGLIDENRENEKGWRKFNLVEMVWLHILHELRSFGYPNDKIAVVKMYIQTLHKSSDSISNSKYLQYYIAIAFLQKLSSFLIVFEDGKACLVNNQDLAFSELVKKTPNHLKININHILSEIYPNKNFTPIDQNVQLTQSEIDFLYELRCTNASSIKVVSKEGNITKMEVEENINPTEKFYKLLLEEDYQDILISKRDKKVVKIKRTKLKKPT